MTETSASMDSEIVRGRVEMRVPHLSSRTTFVCPAVGPGNYQSVGRQIKYINDGGKERESGLVVPVGDVSASLLDAAYFPSPKNNDAPEFANVMEIMRVRWMPVFQKNRWCPKGVYIAHDLEAKGLSEALDVGVLESAVADGNEVADGVVFSRDGTVRFVSADVLDFPNKWDSLPNNQGVRAYKDHTPESLAEDAFVIGGYGLEGARKLARVSTRFRNNSRVYGLKMNEGMPAKEVLSALSGDYFDGFGLGVVGCFDGDGDGYAFGVSPSTEGA